MGKLVTEGLDYLANSYEAQRNLGIKDGSGSSKDAKMNMIEDSLARTELELAGIDSQNIKTEQLIGRSMDSSPAFYSPDLTNFDRTLREVEYADIDILKNMQVTSAIPVGAIDHKYLLDDYTGSYKRVVGESTDLPTVSLTGQDYTINVSMGGGAVDWNQQEIDNATFAGRPLDTMQVRAVRRAYLQDIYNLVINGDDRLKGITNTVSEFAVKDTVANPNAVTLGTPAAKYWINKTGQEIVSDFVNARIKIATNTQSRWAGAQAGVEGNTSSLSAYVAQSAYYIMLDKFMTNSSGGDRPETVWEYLNSERGRRATGITNYFIVHDFDSAFQAGTEAGFAVFPNSPDAYSFEVPLGLTPKPVQFKDLKMIVPYYDYFAGMKPIRQNALVAYYGIAAV